jgi:hypothetical protein
MSRIEEQKRPLGIVLRTLFATITVVMVPPFVMLAVAPMLLMLAPVALVAIPFVVAAFAGQAREVAPLPRRTRELQPAHV